MSYRFTPRFLKTDLTLHFSSQNTILNPWRDSSQLPQQVWKFPLAEIWALLSVETFHPITPHHCLQGINHALRRIGSALIPLHFITYILVNLFKRCVRERRRRRNGSYRSCLCKTTFAFSSHVLLNITCTAFNYFVFKQDILTSWFFFAYAFFFFLNS